MEYGPKGVFAVKITKKALVVIVFVLVSFSIFAMLYVHRTYYPMGGEVTIVEKSERFFRHYITIEEMSGEQFKLSCSEYEFNSLDVGDLVSCERTQSILTHSGKLHKLK